MKKRKWIVIFSVFLLVMWCGWMWLVGFNTGKYSRQETPFNVPGKIIKNMVESAAISKQKEKLVANFEKLAIGSAAPDFSLPGPEPEQAISLSDFNNKIVLLEF